MLGTDIDVVLEPREDTTAQGCKCRTKCRSSSDSYWKCDWCRVVGKCGTWGWRGYWDYCDYKPPAGYEQKAAPAKMAALWNNVQATRGKSAPVATSSFGVVHAIVTKSMRTPFDNHRDVHPQGRSNPSKVIHQKGVVCKVVLQVHSGSTYSGILSAGESEGLIRMGSGTPIALQGVFPGFGLKFLRKGVPSANFLALRQLGLNASSFFDGSFSTHAAPPSALQMLGKFQQAADCMSMVGLSNLCTHNQAGAPAAAVNFPYELLFDPVHKLEAVDTSAADKEDQLLLDLESIPANTHLFNVRHVASPWEQPAELGELRTASECTRTLFGDTKLFYRHQRMEEDFALKPEWIPHVQAEGCEASAKPASNWKCPGIK
eukprot:TRINITY_DN28694_c0_g1_i1.p1 TRINITY_DN28694_c0_g1~~TRINITY_DN28694_c0_g1_i1.p1  ORF type:complete len:374 (+),score=50.46 TRINITY_DN28694_c0_g1_i1:264-1385(+)